MHATLRNRLLNQQRALLLAAFDMRQARAASLALATELDVDLARALETAMLVCFMRPFTHGEFTIPMRVFPKDESPTRFAEIKERRDKVYAHTDAKGGRVAEARIAPGKGELIGMEFSETWTPFPRSAISDFASLCERLVQHFQELAAGVQMMLDGDETVPANPLW